jgi:hypothetical protein
MSDTELLVLLLGTEDAAPCVLFLVDEGGNK